MAAHCGGWGNVSGGEDVILRAAQARKSSLRDYIRVRVLMERRMLREGLVYVLHSDPRIRVVDSVSTVGELPDASPEAVDVLLIDLDDYWADDGKLVEEVMQLTKEVPTVAVASSVDTGCAAIVMSARRSTCDSSMSR